jgi:two-component system response regulator MprA
VNARSKILVVEDDDALRDAIAASISGLGVDVAKARDGAEGMAHLAPGRSPPDAILLDMRVPRSGRGFLDVLRASPRLAHIPVITMTGGPLTAAALPRAPAGIDPFDVEELARILVSLCEP